MAARDVTFSDLAHDPADVARGLIAWERGDRDEAVAKTLAASARELHGRRYTLWLWTARNDGGDVVWMIPVAADQTRAFSPRGPATVLLRTIAAAVDTGAVPDGIRLLDWQGWTALELPGADAELAALALAERHPDAARLRVARLPDELVGAPAEIELQPLVRSGNGLTRLAHDVHAHPVEVALTLVVRGQDPETVAHSPEMVENLRTWGLSGAPPEEAAPDGPPGMDQDPCPRRRHARKVLQRLLRMGKVGTQHHTAVDHLYRGAPADQRREAMEVGEALIRAGLLGEKPSVGQRHVYLRREALPEIHALINRGESRSPTLTEMWTADPPG